MERPFYDVDEDRTNLVPSLQQDAPWVQVPDACAGVDDRGTIYGHYDAYPSYHAMGSDIMLWGYPDVHNTPSNQGQGSNLYLAGTIDGYTHLRDYDATNATYSTTNTAHSATNAAYGDASAAYGTASAAYGTTNATYGAINAAYGAGTNTGDLTRGIWPSTDPVSTLMGYDHGVADINSSVYPLVPNPALAPGTTTPVQAGYEPAVANTDGSHPQCSTCNTTFKRASDLARHEKKHQARRAFKCLVPGCGFKGSYRKDKLDAHVKSCHRRGAV